MMMTKRSNDGFTFIELMVVLALVSSLSLGAAKFYLNQVVPERRATVAANEINAIRAAAIEYHLEYQRWPDSVEQLISLGLYTGPAVSNADTPYALATTSDGHLGIRVDTRERGIANRIAGKVNFASVSGAEVVVMEGVPTRDIVQSYFLARRQIDGCPECNTMETSIDMAGNSIANVNEFDAQLAMIEQAFIETANIQTINNVESIDFGGPRISAAGNELLLDADMVRTTGGMVLGGTLDMAGQDILNANRIVGEEVTATVGFIDDITGINLDYVTGQIQLLSGQELNYVTGEIRALSGVELDYVQGRVRQLTGDQLTYGSGTISNLAGSNLNYGSGTIGNLSGTTLNYGSGTIGNLSGTTLNYNNGTIGNLSGTTLNYTNVNAGSVIAGSGRHSTLTVLGNSLLNTLQSTQYTTGTYRSTSATAQTVNVSDRLQTANLVSAESSLGVAQASSFDVSGLLSSAGLTTNFANVQQGQIQSVSGTNMTYASIHAGEFIGGTFYGDDFITSSGASENQIRIDLDQRKAELDNCMYITEFCMPKAPDISLSCPGCVQTLPSSSFSATVTASISQCRHGCSYQWTLGSGLSGSCPSGSIPPGGSGTVQCVVTGSVDAASTLNSSVQIYAQNSARPDKNTTRTANVRWTNSSPPIPPWYDSVGISCSPSTCSDIKNTENHDATSVVSARPTINGSTNWSTSCPSCTWSALVQTSNCYTTGHSSEDVYGHNITGVGVTSFASASQFNITMCDFTVFFQVTDGVNTRSTSTVLRPKALF